MMKQEVGNCGAQESSCGTVDLTHHKITVYTSKRCIFCQEVTNLVKEAASRLTLYKNIAVTETFVDSNPGLIEEHDLLALPTVQIGKVKLVGLPSVDDIEQHIHQMVLTDWQR